jgi:EAL domain-containing protein (putative c-di-GMP-specific phosphodiesterase class I)
LTLAFQPLIELETGAVSGFEALARWDHEERGPISPTEFIPVAEESGLILSLGRWALVAAARTLADWDQAAGKVLPINVAVNLSAIQIGRDDIASAVSSALRSSSIAGDRLTLELTESAIIQDPVRATRVLEALKGLDTRVAMDDFGTGYTSLSYLQRLPIDMLKIDRSFVTGMLRDRDAVSIIRAVLSLADALGMSTTAEGIESAELAKALTDLGCTHGQGFHYSRPLAPDAALRYWLSRNA